MIEEAMARNTIQKGTVRKMKKLLLSLPEDMHTALKIRAAEQKSTIREIVTGAIQHELEKGGTKKK
jgi:plasmid stability protein